MSDIAKTFGPITPCVVVTDDDDDIDDLENIGDSDDEVIGGICQDFPKFKDALSCVDVLVNSMRENKGQDFKNDSMNEQVLKPLLKLYNFYRQYDKPLQREMLGNKLIKTGACLEFVDYVKILTFNGDKYPKDDINFYSLSLVYCVCVNYTDANHKLCEQFARAGLIQLLLGQLEKFQHTFEIDKFDYKFIGLAMGILHNCAEAQNNIAHYIALNAVRIVAWYAKNNNKEMTRIRISSIMTLVCIVDEEHNDVILAGDSIIKTIIMFLDKALKESEHRYNGFSADELTRGLTRLACNAKNSAAIVENGFLKSALEMLKGGTVKEQTTAARSVWVLSFESKNKEEIKSQSKIVELLNTFSTSNDVKLKKAAKGALWVLNKQMTQEGGNTVRSVDTQNKTGTLNHVMISYQWDCQKMMIKLKKKLEESRYRVWMDLDKMSGSTLQCMAEAVENSAVILVCMSQKYKNSASCRTEASYAYDLRKDIVPIRVEPRYKPDNWLGALVATKLYFDFSDPKKFKNILPGLVKELNERGKLNEELIVPVEVDGSQAPPGEFKTTERWDFDDVTKWAQENDINTSFTSHDIDGKVLLFMKKLQKKAPEFFYRYVTERLGIENIRDIMNFSNAIEDLSQ